MDELEKEERQKQVIVLKFTPFLPCTTYGCLNPANVGTAQFDYDNNRWLLFPYCVACVEKFAHTYGIEEI